MPAYQETKLKRIPSSKFKEDLALINKVAPLFEDWNSVFDINSSFNVPIRRGNYGEISELYLRLRSGAKEKASYFGTITELDHLVHIK